jgi:tRNA(Arg) A34 adenosine deaminase TadA
MHGIEQLQHGAQLDKTVNVVALMLSARRIQRFLTLAMREAMKSSMKFRHGAVLIKGGKIVGSGYNQDRTCLNGLFVTSLHAEISALKDKSLTATAGTHPHSILFYPYTYTYTCRYTPHSHRRELTVCIIFGSGCDLYIARVSEEGLGDSKPCPECLAALKRFRVRRVFYTLRNGQTASEKVRDMTPYDKPTKTIQDFQFRRIGGTPLLLSPNPP